MHLDSLNGARAPNELEKGRSFIIVAQSSSTLETQRSVSLSSIALRCKVVKTAPSFRVCSTNGFLQSCARRLDGVYLKQHICILLPSDTHAKFIQIQELLPDKCQLYERYEDAPPEMYNNRAREPRVSNLVPS